MVAAASAVAAAVGLRLCGMVEEPPRPGAACSKASATSVCISSETSRAILPQVPVRIAKADGDLREAVAVAVPGRVRQRQVEHRREPLGDRDAAIAERGERAGGAAELQRQRLPAQPPQPFARAPERRRIARELEPERHRHRVLHPGARDRRGAAVLADQVRECVDGAVEIGDQRVDDGAQLEHQRGVDDVLAGRAPVDVGGGIGILAWRPRRSAPSPAGWRYCRPRSPPAPSAAMS